MKRWHKILVGVCIVVGVLALGTYLLRDELVKIFFQPTFTAIERGAELGDDDSEDVIVVASDLAAPWAIASLPGGDLLVTERPGMLRRIGAHEAAWQIDGAHAQGEGGLLGLALDPAFVENKYIYLYKTTAVDNRVERYVLTDDGPTNQHVILDGIPAAGNHNGGRIAFGPDDMLYIATGDAGNASAAQDLGSLAGKILRIYSDGSLPTDAPFGSAVYSYGHRNVQGLAWDDAGRLWATEHGRSGVLSGLDELNLIEPGGNYGWPIIEGDGVAEGMIMPKIHSGAETTWAPASLAFARGSFFFGGLRGQSLYEAKLQADDSLQLRAHFVQDFGRIRDVVQVDGRLLFATSNRDGRGSPQANDDRIISVRLEMLLQ